MEKAYLDLLENVFRNGEDRGDRTGTGTRSMFGMQIRANLADGFPALTTKKLFMKAVVSELLWFLEGSSDNSRLAELNGTETTIWTGNASGPGRPDAPNAWLTNPHRKGDSDCGRIYGVQWRNWETAKVVNYKDSVTHDDGSKTVFDAKVKVGSIDQIASIINKIKTNPTDRRMILSAYNVGELDQMSLPPCHMFAQFYVSAKRKLSCQVYIRSNDLFLGLPFNIASYALLTHMIAQVTDCEVGDIIITIGDAHIYSNHFAQVEEQLSRTPYALPKLVLNPDIKNIDDFTMSDIQLADYVSHAPIKAPMAV